ncbi:MAG: hypothetical protein RLZZ453_99 [Chlamydiota bacterium]|jgi:FMN phosphatase YigB (HAD superfamily)
MKKAVSAFLLGLQCLSAEIIEMQDISHMLAHANQKTLFIFDLDNTLVETEQVLGSDQWVYYMLNRYLKEGHSEKSAIDKLMPEWIEIQKHSNLTFVDPVVPHLLETLKKKQIAYIGITKRDPKVSERTLDQLKQLGISFHPKERLENGHCFGESYNITYKEGILFLAPDADKGSALKAYFKQMPAKPDSIVAIDDKLSNVKSLEAAAKELGIRFIGIRYGALDHKVKNFNSAIADLQYERFKSILSDEEAQLLLQSPK